MAVERAQSEGRAVLSHLPAAVHLAGRQRAGQVTPTRRNPRGAWPRVAAALRVRDRSRGRARPWRATVARAALRCRAHRARRTPRAGATLSVMRDTDRG